jgi:hypothetical protein
VFFSSAKERKPRFIVFIKPLDNESQESICDMTLTTYLSQKNTLPKAISYACKF